MDDRVVVSPEDEQGERGRVAPDRRLGFGDAELERPARGLLGLRPVVGENERLHRADRPAPAPGRSVVDALAVALGGAVEPVGRLVAAPGHEQREPRAAGGVAHPRQLALPRVRVLGQPRLAVLVAGHLAREMLVPVGHAPEDNLHSWASR